MPLDNAGTSPAPLPAGFTEEPIRPAATPLPDGFKEEPLWTQTNPFVVPVAKTQEEFGQQISPKIKALPEGSFYKTPEGKLYQMPKATGVNDITTGQPINYGVEGSQEIKGPSVPGTLLRSAVHGALPAAGGVAGMGAGMEVGAALGAPFGPIGAGIGAAGGALVGGFGGGYAVGKAQDAILSQLPESVKKIFGQSDEQRQADEATNPKTAFVGELFPNLAAFSPFGAAHAIAEGAGPVARFLAHPAGSRVAGASLMGGQEAAGELVRGEPLDPTKIGLSAGAGALMNKPTPLGNTLMGYGARPVQAITGRPAMPPVVPGAESPLGAGAAPGEAPPPPPPVGSTFGLTVPDETGAMTVVPVTVTAHTAQGDVVIQTPDGTAHTLPAVAIARLRSELPQEAANAPPEAPPAQGAESATAQVPPAPSPAVEAGQPIADLAHAAAQEHAAAQQGAVPPETTQEDTAASVRVLTGQAQPDLGAPPAGAEKTPADMTPEEFSEWFARQRQARTSTPAPIESADTTIHVEHVAPGEMPTPISEVAAQEPVPERPPLDPAIASDAASALANLGFSRRRDVAAAVKEAGEEGNADLESVVRAALQKLSPVQPLREAAPIPPAVEAPAMPRAARLVAETPLESHEMTPQELVDRAERRLWTDAFGNPVFGEGSPFGAPQEGAIDAEFVDLGRPDEASATAAPAMPPAAAPAAGVPEAPGPRPSAPYRTIRGETEPAYIPSTGAAVPIEYGIMDARDLVTSHHDDLSPNTEYPQALQPRSRERAETEAQIAGILNGDPRDPNATFRPELMGESADAANGSPIVGPEGYVESGNARTMAIRRAYDRGLPQAEEYRQYLASRGYPIEGVEQPVLVRINRGDMDMPQREQLARDLNVSPQATMSATDRAMADAQQIPADILRAYQGGDMFSAANRGFWKGVLSRIAKDSELPALNNPDSGLSPAGETRITNAILAKAYGDRDTIAALTEDPDSNIKAIGGALTDSAVRWAQLRQAVADGHVPQSYDMTSHLLEAVRLIAHARNERRHIWEFMRQRGLFGEGIAPETEWLLRWMLGDPEWSLKYGRKKMAETISGYAESVVRPRRIGETLPDPAALVENAREVAHGAAGDLFASPLGEPGSATPVREGDGENRPEVQGQAVDRHGVAGPEGSPRGAEEGAGPEGLTQHGRVPLTHEDRIEDYRAFAGDRTDLHQAARDYVVDRGRATGHEYTAVVDANGVVGHALTSNHPSGTRFSPDLAAALNTSDAGLVVHHYHPGDRSLSDLDIGATAAPGMGWVVAHGPSGDFFASRMSAEARSVFDRYTSIVMRNLYQRALGQITGRMRQLIDSGAVSAEDAGQLRDDLVNRALDAAGVTEYLTSRSTAPIADPIFKNMIRQAASAVRDMARRLSEGRFKGASDAELSRIDRSTQRVQFNEGVARFPPTDEGRLAAGRPGGAGDDLAGGRGIAGAETVGDTGSTAIEPGREEVPRADISSGEPVPAERTETGASEPAQPDDLPAERAGGEGDGGGNRESPNGETERGSGLAENAPLDEAEDRRIAERILGHGGGDEPPAPPGGTPPHDGPPGRPPPGGSGDVDRDLGKVMFTDDRGLGDKIRSAVAAAKDHGLLLFRQRTQDQLAALEHAEKSAHGGKMAPGNLSPTMLARLAMNSNATLDLALTRHQVRYNPDTSRIEPIPDSKPLYGTRRTPGILSQLTQDQRQTGRKTVNTWAAWKIANRSERLMSEGREHNVPQWFIDKWKTADRAWEAPDGTNLFHQVDAEMKEWHTRLLDVLEASGVVNHDQRALWEHDDYIPFYRALEDDGTIAGPKAGRSGNILRSPIRQLKGGEEKINNVYENYVLNAASILRRSMENIARQKAETTLLFNTDVLTPMSKEPRLAYGDPVVQRGLREAGIDPSALTDKAKEAARDLFGALKRRDPDVWSVMRDGKARYYRVNDPLVLESLLAAGPSASTGAAALLTAPARLLRGAVVFDPAFALAHNFRMAMHSWTITGVNPIASVVETLRQIGGPSEEAMRLQGAGAMSGRYDIGLPAHVRKEFMSPEYQKSIIYTPLQAARFLHRFGEEVMQAADIGPRIAVYKDAIRRGMPEAEAIDRARDLLDFSTHGNAGAVMFLMQTIPFLNARVQGLARSYRGFAGEDRNAILMRGALITAATIALWEQNKDDPEYQRKPDWDRQYALQIKVAPNTWLRLPKWYEMGTFFSTIPEMLLDYGHNGSGRQLQNAATSAFFNVFRFNPVPVAIRPIAEVMMNHDMFTGQPIIGEREAQLDPALQYGPADSASVVALTNAYNAVVPDMMKVAPATLQHLLQGYLAGWGTYVTAAADHLGDMVGALPSHAAPLQTPVLGRFLHETPEAGNRLMNDYYSLRHHLDGIAASMKKAEASNDDVLTQQLRASHPEFNKAIQTQMDRAGLSISKAGTTYQNQYRNPNLSAAQKTKARDDYYRLRDQILDTLKPTLRQAEGLPAQP